MASDNSPVNMEGFYTEKDPEISEQARKILASNGIAEEDVVSHVRAVVQLAISFCVQFCRVDPNAERQRLGPSQVPMHRLVRLP